MGFKTKDATLFKGALWQGEGKWNAESKAASDGATAFFTNPENGFKNTPESVAYFRAVFEMTPVSEEHEEIHDLCRVEEIKVGGPDFHVEAVEQQAFVHRPKGAPKTGRKCMVYFHGGGCVLGSAK